MDEQRQEHQPARDADPFAVRPTPYARLEAGAHLPGALDHAWVVEGLDQQWGLALGGDQVTSWIIRARCAHCGGRTQFRADDVPPCRPQEAQP